MTTNLDNIDLDYTKEIISIGLAKSADSLSFFLNEKVYLNPFDLKFNTDNYFPLSKKSNNYNNSYLLTTSVKGDFKGKAYLIFSEQEVETIFKTNFGPVTNFDAEQRLSMIRDFLCEIDNIITASVITQFSNLLKHNIYGDVPKLDILPSTKVNEFLRENNPGELKIFYFNTRFITKKVEISPEFIWLLDDSFFNKVNKIIADVKEKTFSSNTDHKQ